MEVALLLFFAGLAGAAVRRMRLPAALGYLAVGVAVSPFTPGYVADRDQVQLLADAGLVLLLFELGVELDFRALRHRYRRLSVAAIAQVAITAATTTAVLVPVGFEVQGAAAVGLAVALSSTVIIVNITRSSRRTTDQPTEESLIAWSLVQDVSGVILGTLLVSGIGDEASAIDVLWVAARLIGFAVLMFAVGRWLLPRILTRVERQPDTFLIVVVTIGFVLAGIGAVAFELSLALAAFLGGLSVTSESHGDAVRRELGPFRDLFAVSFFVAIGTLVDPATVVEEWPVLLALLLAVVLKGSTVWLVARVMGLKARHTQLALGLAQIGEFSFVLAGLVLAAGAIDEAQFTVVLAASVLSMAASTVLVRLVKPCVSPASPAAPVLS